jgi:hypothetical protein
MLIGFKHLHSTLAYLLLASSLVSLVCALVQLGGIKAGALRVARITMTKVEPALLGTLGLFGVALWVMVGWPFSFWLAYGLVVWAAMPIAMARSAKPQLVRLEQGDASAAGKLALWAGVNAVVIAMALVFMLQKTA